MKIFKVIFCGLFLLLPNVLMADLCNGRTEGEPKKCLTGEGWNFETKKCEVCSEKNKGKNRFVSFTTNFTKKTGAYCEYQTCQFVCLEEGNPAGTPKGCASSSGYSDERGWNEEIGSCEQCLEGAFISSFTHIFEGDKTSCLYYRCGTTCNNEGQVVGNGECVSCERGQFANMAHTKCVSESSECEQGFTGNLSKRQCVPCPQNKSWYNGNCVDVCPTGARSNTSLSFGETVNVCAKCPDTKPYTYVTDTTGSQCFADLSGMALDGKDVILCKESEDKFAMPDHSECASTSTASCPAGYYLDTVNRTDGITNETLLQCVSCPANKPFSFIGRNMSAAQGVKQCVDDIEGFAIVNREIINCQDQGKYASLDNLQCLDNCSAGTYPYKNTASKVSQCKQCDMGKVSSEGDSKCKSCIVPGITDRKNKASVDHTVCLESCPAGTYSKRLDGDKYQCMSCEKDGVYVLGRERLGCYEECPEGTELHSDGKCHECSGGTRWIDGVCVSDDDIAGQPELMFGKRCIWKAYGDLEYLQNDVLICTSCPVGEFAMEDHTGCQSDTSSACSDEYGLAWKDGVGQCVPIKCGSGDMNTYIGYYSLDRNTRKYVGCSTCTAKGEFMVESDSGDPECYRCGPGLYFDESAPGCKKCVDADPLKPYSDGHAIGVAGCRKFDFYKDGVGYAYLENADGSLNKVACSAKSGRYAPAEFIGKCVTSCDDDTIFQYADVYQGRGQCVDCQIKLKRNSSGNVVCNDSYNRECYNSPKTPGYYAFGASCVREDKVPTGFSVDGNHSVYSPKTCGIDSNSNVENYNKIIGKSEGVVPSWGSGCLASCPTGVTYTEIPVYYPKAKSRATIKEDATEFDKYVTVNVKQCKKFDAINCAPGEKLITSKLNVSSAYFQNFPDYVAGKHKDNNYENGMNERVRGGVMLYVDICVPDSGKGVVDGVEKIVETCTMNEDDVFSKMKYAIPNSQSKFNEYAEFAKSTSSVYYKQCYNIAENMKVETLGENNLVDNNLFAKFSQIEAEGNIHGLDFIEAIAGNRISPYFDYSYTRFSGSGGYCMNAFCNYYTEAGVNGGGCNTLFSNNGEVTNFYENQKDLWDYYLKAVIYKLVHDTSLISGAGDTSGYLNTQINYASEDWKNQSAFAKSAIDYFLFYWAQNSNETRNTYQEKLSNIISHKLNDNYRFNVQINTFEKIPGSAAHGTLDYSIMNEVYCVNSSLLYDKNICDIVRKYTVVTLDGSPTFECSPGTTTVNPSSQLENKNCKALMLDIDNYNNNRNDSNYVQQFFGICPYVCPAGTYVDNTKAGCQLCPAGTFSNKKGATVCEPCPAGRYSDTEGMAECLECPAGTYNERYGALSCVSCPAGTGATKAGATVVTDCKVCEPGYYSESGQGCIPCPKGAYQPASGQSSCNLCPVGSTTEGTGAKSNKECTETASAYTFKLPAPKFSGVSFSWPSFLKVSD